MIVLKWTNLAAIFFLELCLLAALGYWGFHVGKGPIGKAVLGLGAPLLLALLWGSFMAPKAWRPLPAAPHLIAEIVLFGLGAAALYAVDRPRLAVAFGLAWLVTRVLATFLR